MALLVPPPITSVVDGASVDTLIPPRVPGVGATVGAATPPGAGARVAARGEVVAAGVRAVAGAVVVDAMGTTLMATGEDVASGSAAKSGEGVGGWATAVGSAVGAFTREGVGSGVVIGADVCGGVG